MIKEGNLERYLIYAIGEIVLVGILIALQVNQWNQNGQERILGIKILKEIRENIIQDSKDHQQNLSYLRNSNEASEIILEKLNDNSPYHDSLSRYFSWAAITPSFHSVKSGCKLLESKGMYVISNDSLCRNIAYIYDNSYSHMRDFLER